MAKKKVEQVELEDVKPRLKSEEYWKWRNSISEMWLEEKKLEIARKEYQNLELKIALDNAKLALMKVTKIKHCELEASDAKKRYDSLKSELEKSLGVSLSGKAVDEFTLEVVELPEGEK